MKFSKILCAITNDSLADKTFEVADALAQQLHAELALVSSIEIPVIEGLDPVQAGLQMRKEIDLLYERLLALKSSPNIRRFCEEGIPQNKIIETAINWEANLIILASHARNGITRVLMGSVAEHVLRRSKCPVLIVPANKQ